MQKVRGPYRKLSFPYTLVMPYASFKIENNAQPVSVTWVDEDLAENFYNVVGEHYLKTTPSVNYPDSILLKFLNGMSLNLM